MSIEDTSKRDPLEHLIGVGFGSGRDQTTEYITGMEADGQRQVVNSTKIPTERQGDDAQWEALGFVFGDVDASDPLFQEVQLPPGWSRRGTSHSMWSDIVDERDIVRVAVFYKAAFYDRRAGASLVNVGSQFVTEAVYGDDVANAISYEKLTQSEIDDVIIAAQEYVTRAKERPAYADRLPRAEAVLKGALEAAGKHRRGELQI